jgi:hypothetical protein
MLVVGGGEGIIGGGGPANLLEGTPEIRVGDVIAIAGGGCIRIDVVGSELAFGSTSFSSSSSSLSSLSSISTAPSSSLLSSKISLQAKLGAS